jgi:murein DD-endopeptidase MepM/ murein hydrolase activator NlpD
MWEGECAMRKKEHSGSAAVIGAQLVILFILTVSLCVQSRKAAAENTYAVMEKSGEGSQAGESGKAGEAGDSQKKKYIHWVEFNVPSDVMEKAFRLDMGTVQEEVHFNWVELLAYLGAKYGGDFERFRQTDLDAVVEKLKSGSAMEEIAKDMKYYAYYREAYGAVLDGMVGYFEQESGNDKVWLRKYGLKVFSPIAKNFPYSDFDDFGASRSYGFKRKHLGHDMMGQVGTPVIAVESGYVEALGWNQYGGWRIGIRSFDKKRYYYYAHLRQNYPYQANLKEGSIVTAGDVIGYLGRTGYSTTENTNNITTPHLHFGIQLIFDESQKEGNNEIWINCYEIVKFLRMNQSETVKVEGTKEWTRVYNMKDPGIPESSERTENLEQPEESEGPTTD